MRKPTNVWEELDAYIYQAYFNISGQQTTPIIDFKLSPIIIYVHPPAQAMT
jgi:hypothetical protein